MHRLPAMLCGHSLRFVYAVKLYAAILSGKSVAISLRQRYGCGCDAFCDGKWPNLLLAAEIPCDFRLRFKKSLAIAVAKPWLLLGRDPCGDRILSSGRESQRVSRTVQTLLRTGGNCLKRGFAPCKRLFREPHPGGPKTPFAPSLSTFGPSLVALKRCDL